MPTHISLIRHGETPWNAVGRWQGHAHVPLSDEGRRQAAILAEYIAEQHEPVDAIYSSDLWRTHETAQIIAARLNLPIVLDTRLREIDMGEWQGLTKIEIQTWDAERYHQLSLDPKNTPRPSGESSNQVAERAIQALNDIVTKHPDGYVLVVTHGGTIRNILDRLEMWSGEPANIGNTSLTRVRHDPANAAKLWNLDFFNRQEHLTALLNTTANTTQEE